jgi:hypothetical protein
MHAATVVDADFHYALWLLAQSWFKTKHRDAFVMVRQRVVRRLTEEIEFEEHVATQPIRVIPLAEYMRKR